MPDYDVIVVGAGMVGLTMANLLAKQELSVAVFDRQAPPEKPNAEQRLRVSAISRASENILRHLGCWNDIALYKARAYEYMHVWDVAGKGSIAFDAAAIGEPNLGHIIPNVDIQGALWQSLTEQPKVSLMTDVTLAEASWHEDAVKVSLDDGSEYSAKMVIAADGAHSWLRDQAGIAMHSKPYEHWALVATIKTEKPHGNCARQAFLETGPLAFLPTSDKHECSIVWSTSESEVRALCEMSDDDFNTALTIAFGEEHLGNLSCQSKRLSFPLIARHADKYIKPRLALIGDAAHTIHPLAGQGANIGILDAASLAEIIAENQQRGYDFSTHANLRPYERWRRSENQLMLDSMRAFRELFAGDDGVKAKLRSFGMSQLNQLPMIKKPVIESAMGMRGDLPQNARTPMPDI